MRLTCFATNTSGRPIAELELRHRLRARAEDRIRAARATGLRNLPLHRTAQNRIWLEIVQIALDLLAWMPMLALTGKARLWEPRRLRLRLFTAAGQLVTTGRRRILRLARHWPWTGHITARPRPAHPTARTPADQQIPRPFDSTSTPGAVESGATPRRHSGLRPAQPQPTARKRSTDSVGGPSRNFEASQRNVCRCRPVCLRSASTSALQANWSALGWPASSQQTPARPVAAESARRPEPERCAAAVPGAPESSPRSPCHTAAASGFCVCTEPSTGACVRDQQRFKDGL